MDTIFTLLPDDDNGMRIEDYQGYKLRQTRRLIQLSWKRIEGNNRTLYLIFAVPGSGTTSQKRQWKLMCLLILFIIVRIIATGLVASFSSQWSTIQVHSAQNCSLWATRHLVRSPLVYFGLLRHTEPYWVIYTCYCTCNLVLKVLSSCIPYLGPYYLFNSER